MLEGNRDVQDGAPVAGDLPLPLSASGDSYDGLGGLAGIGGEAPDSAGTQPEFQVRRRHDDPLHQ